MMRFCLLQCLHVMSESNVNIIKLETFIYKFIKNIRIYITKFRKSISQFLSVGVLCGLIISLGIL